MTGLRDDLDRALRSVTTGEAPVRRAMSDGRRLRNRRRLAVLASALAIAAVATASPSLARLSAGPGLPATSHPATPPPSLRHGDLVVTDQPPAPGAPAGTVAQGTVGGVKWAVGLSGSEPSPQGPAYFCYAAHVARTAAGPASGPAAQLIQSCTAAPIGLTVVPAAGPAGLAGDVIGPAALPPEQVVLGVAAADVAYFTLAFTDGQELKLIPVSGPGQRYIAWMAPADMNVASLTAHLGGPHFDNGQTETAVPFQPAGTAPQFGLWLKPGQAAPPRASAVIGHGTGGEPNWSVSAYEGPWGTCFVAAPGAVSCASRTRLTDTGLIGLGGDPPAPAFGSAAPGVAWLRVSLSNGKSVQVTPVSVGNERLFACWPGAGVTATEWTAYDAAGRAVTGGASVAAAAAAPLSAGRARG